MKLLENKYISFIYRNAIWLGLLILALWFFKAGYKEIDTMLLLVAFEGLALGLSGISVFVFTSIDFMKELTAGEDMVHSVNERASRNIIIGLIFLGVHLLVGFGIFSIYLARFAGVVQ